jgi:hypothetical protein
MTELLALSLFIENLLNNLFVMSTHLNTSVQHNESSISPTRFLNKHQQTEIQGQNAHFSTGCFTQTGGGSHHNIAKVITSIVRL